MSPHNSSIIQRHLLMQSQTRFVTLLALTLLTANCAKVVGPPGGPQDKTPPVILSAEPHSHQTMVPPGNTFSVVFSESIDPRSVTKQFFVSPRQATAPKLKVRGVKLEAILADSFALDQTYVITIGSGVRDMRGNQLGASKSFAFTRGAEIDTSSIAGVVTDSDSPASGVGVALFRRFLPTTLGDMDSLFPDYFTVSGSDGGFELAFLPADEYFILAFRDKDRNQLFQYGVEDFGLTTKKLYIGSATYDNLEVRMQKLDTTQTTIISATFNIDRLLRINLSRKLDPRLFSDKLEFVRLLNPADSSTVTSASAMKDEHGEATKKFQFYFEELRAGEFLLAIDFAALYSDGRIEREQMISLSRADAPDTHLPTVETSHSERIVAPWETLQWSYSFNEPLTLDSSNLGTADDSTQRPIVITDSRGANQVNDILLSTSPFEYIIITPTRPVNGERYTLTLNPQRLIDFSGNSLADSVLSAGIDVWPSDSLGSLSMTIDNRFDSLYTGGYYVKLNRLTGREYWIVADSADSIKLELAGGDYVVEVIVDSTQAAVGSLYPLRFAAPRAFYPDTVHVRPRFDTEGIRIIIE